MFLSVGRSHVDLKFSSVTMTHPLRPWFVYLIRAENGSLYCGITDNPERRFKAHQQGKGARFFHSSPAKALVYTERCLDKSSALRRERAIKKLRKSVKESMVLAWV